jgi:ribosomal protein L7/L12
MTGDKIPCIKALREEFSGLSLLGAKLTVEELDVNKAAEILRNHWTPPVV